MDILNADTLKLLRHAAFRAAIRDVADTGEPRTVTITVGRATRTITVRRLD